VKERREMSERLQRESETLKNTMEQHMAFVQALQRQVDDLNNHRFDCIESLWRRVRALEP
jgi:hypothetical protein